MEFLIVDISATSAALLGYLALVFWHDVTSGSRQWYARSTLAPGGARRSHWPIAWQRFAV